MPITICIAVMQSPIAPGKRGMSAASSERMISITPEYWCVCHENVKPFAKLYTVSYTHLTLPTKA